MTRGDCTSIFRWTGFVLILLTAECVAVRDRTTFPREAPVTRCDRADEAEPECPDGAPVLAPPPRYGDQVVQTDLGSENGRADGGHIRSRTQKSSSPSGAMW
jgi:hypothetical protein